MSSRIAVAALIGFVILAAGPAGAQESIRPDLAGAAEGQGWTLANRAAAAVVEDGTTVVSLDARPYSGAAWLDGFELENGTIEVRIRGSNTPQASFVGIAFRGLDDETYDAVYFRPFNFVADNDLSRSHMVQYISHPEHTWSQLRSEHTGVYENALPEPPDPDRFFHARIEIDKPQVRVYVNGAADPCLVVEELTDRTGGRVGLWVGHGAAGSFADLVIRPAPKD